MDQLQSLLKPVKNEEDRLNIIAGEEIQNSSAINKDAPDVSLNSSREMSVSLSSEAKQAEIMLQQDDS